jgi:hypothetical protein
MDGTLAQGRAVPGPAAVERASRRASMGAGTAVVLAMLAIYLVSNPVRTNFYDHFVWQASAWLEGKAAIRYPVYPGDKLGAVDFYFQDVLPVPTTDGVPRALIPFPPLPAVVLLPFVAVFGLATNAQLIASVLGALVVGLGFWVLGRLPVRPSVRLTTTILFGLGTVFWYASELGSTWFLAHVVAVGLTFLSLALALDGDPRALAAAGQLQPSQEAAGGPPEGLATPPGARVGGGLRAALSSAWSTTWPLDPGQVAAGVFLGLAATARLTVALGFPFLVLVGGGGTMRRRTASAAAGMAIPLLGLAAYDLLSTGHVFNPVYDHLYRTEISFFPPLFPYLDYHADWAIEDPRYLLQNLWIMLFNLPQLGAPCPSGVPAGPLQAACLLQPRADGMSLILTSPALLLALPALRAWRSRLVAGGTLAVVAIAVGDLMHFSQGWVQFGYRFSNDFIPFLLLLVALGMERIGGVRRSVVVLVAISISINLWGVAWGHALGW